MSIKNINDLNSQADNLLPDNSQQLISPADVRNTIRDLNDSALNRINDRIYLNLRTYNSTRTYEPGEGCFYGTIIYEAVNTTTGAFNPADWTARSSPNGTWGSILGDVNNQTDLIILLDSKQNALSANGPLYLSGNVLNINQANTSTSGYLNSADWNVFHGKENALNFNAPIIRSGDDITIPYADGTNDGVITSAEWINFTNKENALTFEFPIVRSEDSISIPYVSEGQDGILSSAQWESLQNLNEQFIDIYYNDAIDAITNETLRSGKYYRILGGSRPNEGVGTNGNIILQALSKSSFAKDGYLNTYVPKYSEINGLIKDIWTNGGTPEVDDIYLFSGAAYKNLTGINGGNPSSDTTNWELVIGTDTSIYQEETDRIRYDIANDWIYYREDKRGNKISFSESGSSSGVNAIDLFQWGNDQHYNNVLDDAFLENINDGRNYRNLKLSSCYFLPSTFISVSSSTGYVENLVMLPGTGSAEIFGSENLVQGSTVGVSVSGNKNIVHGSATYTSLQGSHNLVKSDAQLATVSGNYNNLFGKHVLTTLDSNSDHNLLSGNFASFGLTQSDHNSFFGNFNSVTLNNASHSFFAGNVSALNLTGNSQFNTGLGSFSGNSMNGAIGNVLLNTINGSNISGQHNIISGSLGGNTFAGNYNFVGGNGGGVTVDSNSSINMLWGQLGGNQILSANNNILLGQMSGIDIVGSSYNFLGGFASGADLSSSSQYNVLLGYAPGVNVSQSNYNTLLGFVPGNSLSLSSGANFIAGNSSGNTMINSNANAAIGSVSGFFTGSSTNFIGGYLSASFDQSSYNVALGYTNGVFDDAMFNFIGGYSSAFIQGSHHTMMGYLSGLSVYGNKHMILGSVAGTVSGNSNTITGLTDGSVSGNNNMVHGGGNTVNVSGDKNISYYGNHSISGTNNFLNGNVLNNVTGSNNLIWGNNANVGNWAGSGNVALLNRSTTPKLLFTSEAFGNVLAGTIGDDDVSTINGQHNVLIGRVNVAEISSDSNIILGETASITIPNEIDNVAIINVQTAFEPDSGGALYIPNNLKAVASNGKIATHVSETLTNNRIYTFQDGDGTVAFLSDIEGAVDNALPLSGGTMTGMILFETTEGIDTVTGSSNVLNIGASNADVINIGNSGATINILGDLIYENVTNLEVTDKLIRINKSGSAASAYNAGFELEENSTITGYVKTNSGRDGWLMKAPAGNELSLMLNGLTSARSLTVPDLSGTILLAEGTQTISGAKTFSNGLTSQNALINGIAGNGYLELSNQSSTPSSPAASGVRLFAGSGLSWNVNSGADTYSRTLASTLTANRTYTLFDANDTLVGTTVAQALSNKTLTAPVINVGSDAAGDIYFRNSGGNFTRLAIGSNNNVLTVTSGFPAWTSPSWLSLSGGILSGDVGNTSTGYLRVPNGTTAQRPGTSTNGMLRYNTTLNKFEVYENGVWVSFASSTGSYLSTSGGTLTGDVDNTSTGYFRVPSGSTAQRPGSPSNGMMRYNSSLNEVEAYRNGSWTSITGSGGGSSSIRRTYSFTLIGEANDTKGYFSKAAVTAGNPSGMLPTTAGGSPGFNNGTNDPYLVLNNCTVSGLRFTVYGLSVAQGTVGSSPSLRLALYKIGATSRTLVGNFDVAVNPSSVGVWNNASGNNFQTAALSGLSLSLNAGDLIGIEFVNQNTNNNEISSIARMQVVLETVE